ncbi:MAG: HAMP domain-containing sensor histidine kinase [Pseudomonadota bacterium]
MRTLYAKLSIGLVAILLIVGLAYVFINFSLTQRYLEEAEQQLNRNLAATLISDGHLVTGGRLDKTALKATFERYMVINPAIEIYLLDEVGKILAFSADPGKVKRTHVDLTPIQQFLGNRTNTLVLGADPRDSERTKPFSVSPIPVPDGTLGYLYVVLRGEAYESVMRLFQDRYLVKLGVWVVLACLALGLAAGLGLFYVLTRRLRDLTDAMESLRRSGFQRHRPYRVTKSQPLGAIDELDRLGLTFNQMAERIGAQLRELQDRDTARRELIAQVSHDLRTPLANLRGYLETIDVRPDRIGEEKIAHHIGVALRQSEQLSSLVESLFELAHLEARDVEPTVEPFAITELLHDVAIKFRPQARDLDVSIVVTADQSNIPVLADIAMIERVLDNLLANALSHSRPGDVVQLQADIEPNAVRVAVIDQGPGIPSDVLERIFDPFFRVNPSQGKSHAGLGLAIVQKILDLHDESIDVVSAPNDGATFIFRLDRAPIAISADVIPINADLVTVS